MLPQLSMLLLMVLLFNLFLTLLLREGVPVFILVLL